jgi:hypothetical protein
MSDLNNTVATVTSAFATAPAAPAPTPVIATSFTALEDVRTMLEQHSPDLRNYITFSEESAKLVIPAEDIQAAGSGKFLLKLRFSEVIKNVLKARVCLSYVVDDANGIDTLTRGGGEGLPDSRWRNINSNMLPIGALLAAGYFNEEVEKSVYEWAMGGAGSSLRLYLPAGTSLEIELRANKQVAIDSAKAAGNTRNYNQKVAVGELANLGMSQLGFQGALLLVADLGLIFAPKEGVKVALTSQELAAKYGSGASTALAPTATPNMGAAVAEVAVPAVTSEAKADM